MTPWRTSDKWGGQRPRQTCEAASAGHRRRRPAATGDGRRAKGDGDDGAGSAGGCGHGRLGGSSGRASVRPTSTLDGRCRALCSALQLAHGRASSALAWTSGPVVGCCGLAWPGLAWRWPVPIGGRGRASGLTYPDYRRLRNQHMRISA